MLKRIAAAFVPLVDCATLVVARELGFAEREGLTLDLVKEPRSSAAPLGSALPFDRVEFNAADIAAYLEQFSVATAFVDRSQTLHS